jgi:heme/copper-type cytochrome/quinol oxidase subunit 3
VARTIARDGARDLGHARVYGLTEYRRRPSGDELTARVGMAVFLGSWAMLFIALFFAYAFVRARAPAWPPLDVPPIPRLLPAVNTFVIAASSFAVARALRARERGRAASAASALTLAATLGAVFVALQVAVWAGLWRAGLVPSDGAFQSVFYAFTVFHALHVLVGLAAMAWLSLRARKGAATVSAVRLWGWYWHFVGALWGVLYVTIFLA